MSAALLGNWSLFGVLGLAVMARTFGQRAIAMGPVAWTAVAMFAVSTVCLNVWMEAETLESQLFLWRYGILIDALLYLAILLWLAPLKLWATIAGPITLSLATFSIVALHLIAVSEVGPGAKQIAEGAQISLIALLCVLCFSRVKKDDLIGSLLWGVLAINEVISAVFYMDCQFALFGTRAPGAACVQIYGFDPTWLAVYLSLPLCGWFLFRWFRPRGS